jgi:hypothetical protein
MFSAKIRRTSGTSLGIALHETQGAEDVTFNFDMVQRNHRKELYVLCLIRNCYEESEHYRFILF